MQNDYETKSAIPEKESVTQSELSTLNKATSELLAQCEVLENVLHVVLRAQPKEAGSGNPEEQLTAIPSEIRHQRKQVDTANYIIKSILSRLEI